MLDKTTHIRRDPAEGFLALTDHLVFLRLANTRDSLNWLPIENVLKKLNAEIHSYLARENVKQGITQELIIHRNRVRFTLDSWGKQCINPGTWSIMLREELYWKRIQSKNKQRDRGERL